MARPAAAATMVDTGESRIIMPYAPTPSEMKRKWVQTAEGIYVSPQLARGEGGGRIVDIDWPTSLRTARLVSERTGRVYFIASYGEELDAIKRSKQAEQEAISFVARTRNRYETVKAEDGSEFTRIFSHLHDGFEGVDLDYVLKDGYVASLRLGTPDSVSEQPNPDFLDAQLYYGNNPVLRDWGGRFSADADFRASDAYVPLGFRLVWYERKEAERILRERNKSLRQENSNLRRRIKTAKTSLDVPEDR